MKSIKLPLILLIFLTAFPMLAQTTVYIESGEFGRGILKSRSGECFVIAPNHLIKPYGEISIIGENNVKSSGEFLQSFDPDLAIVRITGGGNQECAPWSIPRNYSTVVSKSTEGYLELLNGDGSISIMQVAFSGKTSSELIIEPNKSTQTFAKGMSGSSLYTNVINLGNTVLMNI